MALPHPTQKRALLSSVAPQDWQAGATDFKSGDVGDSLAVTGVPQPIQNLASASRGVLQDAHIACADAAVSRLEILEPQPVQNAAPGSIAL